MFKQQHETLNINGGLDCNVKRKWNRLRRNVLESEWFNETNGDEEFSLHQSHNFYISVLLLWLLLLNALSSRFMFIRHRLAIHMHHMYLFTLHSIPSSNLIHSSFCLIFLWECRSQDWERICLLPKNQITLFDFNTMTVIHQFWYFIVLAKIVFYQKWCDMILIKSAFWKAIKLINLHKNCWIHGKERGKILWIQEILDLIHILHLGLKLPFQIRFIVFKPRFQLQSQWNRYCHQCRFNCCVIQIADNFCSSQRQFRQQPQSVC